MLLHCQLTLLIAAAPACHALRDKLMLSMEGSLQCFKCQGVSIMYRRDLFTLIHPSFPPSPSTPYLFSPLRPLSICPSDCPGVSLSPSLTLTSSSLPVISKCVYLIYQSALCLPLSPV